MTSFLAPVYGWKADGRAGSATVSGSLPLAREEAAAMGSASNLSFLIAAPAAEGADEEEESWRGRRREEGDSDADCMDTRRRGSANECEEDTGGGNCGDESAEACRARPQRVGID